jgi:hypothetical protein
MQRKAVSPSWKNGNQVLRGNEISRHPDLKAPVIAIDALLVPGFLFGRQVMSPGARRPLVTNSRNARFVG